MTASLKVVKRGRETYYETVAEKVNRAHRNGRDSALAIDDYYNGDPGVWQSLRNTLVPDGATIKPGEISKLARGQSLDGKQLLPENSTRSVVAVDITYGVPRGVSLAWANAPEGSPEKKAIETAVKNAAWRANRHLMDSGVISTRCGKGGKISEPVADCAVASIAQFTNRNKEPFMHVHNPFMSLCLRLDGTFGTLDTRPLHAHKTQAGAVFRAELTDALIREGYRISRDGRSFSLVGEDPALTPEFSSRREEILAMKAKIRAGAEDSETAARLLALAAEESVLTNRHRPGADRRLGDAANRLTRAPKSIIPGNAALDESWQTRFGKKGYEPGQYVAALKTAAAAHRPTSTSAPPGDAALAEALAMESVVSARALFRLIAEHTQVSGGGLAKVQAEWHRLWDTGKIQAIGASSSGDLMLSTPVRIASERQSLLDVLERRGEGGGITRRAAELSIARRPSLTDEQAAAIRWVASGDGVVVVEGVAGSGKTYAMGAIVDAALMCGMPVVALTPAWKAAEALTAETGVLGARAIQGFVAELERGDASIPRGALVLVDEAGMVGISDMAPLLRHARAAGAQVLLTGDRLQLESVDGGSPLAAIAEITGVARIELIRRQQVDWQRDASALMAGGASGDGLRAYDARDHITWADNPAAAITALGRDYAAAIRANPNASRIIVAAENADVHRINAVARQAHIDAGLIVGPSVTIATHHRSTSGSTEVREMEVAVGERLMFSEKLAHLSINNGNTATVRAIGHSRRGPTLTIALDKQQKPGRPERTITVAVSDLARRGRNRDAIPRMQAAYAMTTHLSQGQTVDEVLVYAAAGLGARRSYVAMTRHRHDVRVYVDQEALRIQLREREIPITPETLRERFFKNSQQSETKGTISQFVPDNRAWLRTGDLAAVDPVPSVRHQRGRVQFNQALARRQEERATHSRPRTLNAWDKGLQARIEALRTPTNGLTRTVSLDDDRREIRVERAQTGHAIKRGHHRQQGQACRLAANHAAYLSARAQEFVRDLVAQNLRAAAAPFDPSTTIHTEPFHVRPSSDHNPTPVDDDRRRRDDRRDQHRQAPRAGGTISGQPDGRPNRDSHQPAPANSADGHGTAQRGRDADSRIRPGVNAPERPDPAHLRRIIARAKLRAAVRSGSLRPAIEAAAAPIPPIRPIPRFEGRLLAATEYLALVTAHEDRLDRHGSTLWAAGGRPAPDWLTNRYALSSSDSHDPLANLARSAEASARARGVLRVAISDGWLLPHTPIRAVDPADRAGFESAYIDATAEIRRARLAELSRTPAVVASPDPRFEPLRPSVLVPPPAPTTQTPPPPSAIQSPTATIPTPSRDDRFDGQLILVSDYLRRLEAARQALRLNGAEPATTWVAAAITRVTTLTANDLLSDTDRIAAASPLDRPAYAAAITDAVAARQRRTEQQVGQTSTSRNTVKEH